MKIKCGDANPHRNIAMTSKGGCGKKLDILDAYRCTGCGVYFHLDCIYKHFEEEENHDVARNALKRIYDFTLETSEVDIKNRRLLQKIVKDGLDRQRENRRVAMKPGDFNLIYEYWNEAQEEIMPGTALICASDLTEAKTIAKSNPLNLEKYSIIKIEKL